MLTTALKIALRNFQKNRLYTLINISGLAVGLAATWLIGFICVGGSHHGVANQEHSDLQCLGNLDTRYYCLFDHSFSKRQNVTGQSSEVTAL